MSIHYQQGRYRVRVAAQSFSASKNNSPQFVLLVTPIGHYNQGRPGGGLEVCDNYERTIFLTITDKSIDFVIDKLAAIGFDGRSFTELNPETPNHVSLVGIEFDATCKHDEYQGVLREKWDVSTMAVSPGEPLDGSALRKLDARYGSKLKRGVGQAKTVKREVAQATVSNVGDDDIPF